MVNLSTCLLFDTQTTCAKDAGTRIYIYREARLVHWSTATAASGAALKSK